MKIEYCLMSCNDSPFYLDFWPFVSKIWKFRFNITPVLIYVGKNTPPPSDYGLVIAHPVIENIPSDCISLPSQWARYYYTSKFPDNTCIISDIDMFPISHQYFEHQLELISDEEYVHLYPIPSRPMLATCYHVAKGYKFKEQLKLPSTFEESMKQILQFGETIADKWTIDEVYATHLLHQYNINFLPRPQIARLDRSKWKFNEQDIINENYIDCHCIRPVKDNWIDISRITELLCS